ncbi:hypothetical protein KPB2_5541 [Klebsiella pneumoniae Kb677]|nr:hypothetical protein KPB2_5541 [Klebsiella pneumoniae Kb677]
MTGQRPTVTIVGHRILTRVGSISRAGARRRGTVARGRRRCRLASTSLTTMGSTSATARGKRITVFSLTAGAATYSGPCSLTQGSSVSPTFVTSWDGGMKNSSGSTRRHSSSSIWAATSVIDSKSRRGLSQVCRGGRVAKQTALCGNATSPTVCRHRS